jgi:hypothetical protein
MTNFTKKIFVRLILLNILKVPYVPSDLVHQSKYKILVSPGSSFYDAFK